MNAADYLMKYLTNSFSNDACIEILKENNLYYRLGEKIFKFSSKDKVDQRNNRILSKYNFHILSKIISEFNINNIEVITFKGTILSYILFGNWYNRMPGDIDVFVDESDFAKALFVLTNMGYVTKHKNGLSNQHHVVLVSNITVLELHRNIFHPMLNIDESYLLNNHCRKMGIRTFNTTATFLHLLYHLYMDSYLTYKNAYFVFTNRKLPKIKRFLYRAYEIALFSEKYEDQINWEDIQQDLTHQKLRFIFKKMILDIIEIFPHAFPESFLKTVFLLNYVEDEGDQLYKCLRESEIKEKNVDCILSNYINEHWMLRREKNIHQKIGDSFTLFKEIANEKTQPELRCTVNTERLPKGIKLSFDVLNNDFCFSEIDDYDTQKSDGVHLLLCGTEEYSYNSIFFFPKVIHGEIKVVSCDVRNDANDILDEKVVQAEFMKTERGYTITAVFSNHFIEMNHLNSYFYMGFVVSDCSKETQCRKNQLILSEKEEQWYNPIYFAKIEMK